MLQMEMKGLRVVGAVQRRIIMYNKHNTDANDAVSHIRWPLYKYMYLPTSLTASLFTTQYWLCKKFVDRLCIHSIAFLPPIFSTQCPTHALEMHTNTLCTQQYYYCDCLCCAIPDSQSLGLETVQKYFYTLWIRSCE